MLGRAALGMVVVAAAALPAAAQAQDNEPRALYEPARLTAGSSNQWMGVLDASGQALYFVSDRNATAEIFVQQPIDSGPRLLFDNNADVSWPRPSPDGKHLAFISYRADATGDLCVRDAKGESERCLTGIESAEVQPLWLEGGAGLGALMRGSMHGNYQLRRFDPRGDKKGDEASGTVLVERNMLGVAVSPDGRWLAYVPLERTLDDVGISFANRSGRGLTLHRIGESGARRVTVNPDLPGLTGFPAFSPDGRHLYFAQYLNDTNGDGAIDGNDNSVLFRVPFRTDATKPVTTTFPEQLTSAQWNCRYPAPAADRLIATCSHKGSLDIYSLPLSGAVPSQWTLERARSEVHIARNHWTKLLLLARMLGMKAQPAERIAMLRQMVWLHVELREYESAIFHGEQIRRLASSKQDSGPSGNDEALWADIMLELVSHRREDVRLTHGQMSDRYVAGERKRAATLTALAAARPKSDIGALARLVLSEVQDDTGAKDAALASFEAVDPKSARDPLVLEVYAQRARAIHTLRGDRNALLEVYRALASHSAFSTLDRLRFAERFVEALLRGVPHAARPGRVAAWAERIDAESELGLMIQVAGWLLQLETATQEEVRAGIFELYKANKDPDRRRALVLATVRTASKQGNEFLQYQFSSSWTSWLLHSEPERKYAEELFRRVMLERAYSKLSKKDVASARASFYAATVQTQSLEAHIGFIEALAREGKKNVAQEYKKRYAKNPDDPAYTFAKAYLLARQLPAMSDADKREKAEDEAVGLLRKAAETWPRSMEIHHVWGTVLHGRALRKASRDDALAAHSHYLLALDLARDNVRHRATLLQALGLLQAELGNHRVALRHFDERARLPHVRPAGELNFQLAAGRSGFHSGRHDQAVGHGERALELVDSHRELDRYRPLALDRLALYHQSAGQHETALARYQDLIALLDERKAEGDSAGAAVNRVKARLGAVSAALAAKQHDVAIAGIADLESVLAAASISSSESTGPSLRPGAAVQMSQRDYQILVAGLLAQAHRGKGDYAGAARAMATRRDRIAKRISERKTNPDLLELARSYVHLAEYEYQQGNKAQAREYLEAGLETSGEFNERTGSGVNEVGLRLIQSYAELHLYGGVKLSTYSLDLEKELRVAYEFICKNPSPNWQADRFLFSLYLTMLQIAK